MKSKTVRRALIACAAVIAVVCLALFLLPHIFQGKIRYNGAVYVQSGETIAELPAGSWELGSLNGISFCRLDDPNADYHAVNLKEKYAGCPLYQSGAEEQTIYLYDYAGWYIPFVQRDAPAAD